MKRLVLLLPLALIAFLVKPSPGCIAIPRIPPDQVVQDISLPTQRAFLYSKDGKQHMILSVLYQGAPSEFAWVIPTESPAQVDVQPGAPFHELWKATTPRYPVRPGARAVGAAASEGAKAAPPPVTVIERKQAGPYDIAVLEARTSGGLYDWLEKNGFSLHPTVRQALDGYVKKKWYFVAARIRPDRGRQAASKLQDGTIAPLHITYKASELSYPLRVTAGNPGVSELELFVMESQPPDHAGFNRTSFQLAPEGKTGYRVDGPQGTIAYTSEFPTLRKLLPKGGRLSKYTARLTAEERKRDLVFAQLDKRAQ